MFSYQYETTVIMQLKNGFVHKDNVKTGLIYPHWTYVCNYFVDKIPSDLTEYALAVNKEKKKDDCLGT